MPDANFDEAYAAIRALVQLFEGSRDYYTSPEYSDPPREPTS